MNAQDALAWLYGTQWTGIKLGLEKMRALMAALEVPLEGWPGPVFHVAGTNGKGSVCAMLEALCRAGGYPRTGLYTSPHLVQFRERIRLGREMMPEAALAEGLTRLRGLTQEWEAPPTFFELATALALEWFHHQGAQAVVLETGLGGRLDSTNVITPTVAVLAPVSVDHRQYLGETLGEIAAEKAGIFKPGVPVVSAPQEPEVRAVFEATARRVGTTLEWVEEPLPYPVGLAGAHQRWNAALAVAAARIAGVPMPDAREVLEKVEWPGRFQRERMPWGGECVLDGAHNEAAARRLVETWGEVYGGRPTVVLGVLADKEVEAVCRELAALAGEFIAVPVRSGRAGPVGELVALLHEVAPGVPVREAASLEEGLQMAQGAMLVTGSLFLVGEALALARGEALEAISAQ